MFAGKILSTDNSSYLRVIKYSYHSHMLLAIFHHEIFSLKSKTYSNERKIVIAISDDLMCKEILFCNSSLKGSIFFSVLLLEAKLELGCLLLFKYGDL